MALLSLFVPLLLLAMFTKEGESVRCWTCSSDLNPLCNDPFDAMRDDKGDNSYVFQMENCDANVGATFPYLSKSKSVCKKLIKKFPNGQQVVIRGCSWKRSDDYSTDCPGQSNRGDKVTTFCKTCEYDGCNAEL